LKRAYWPDAVDERFEGDAWTYVDRSIELHSGYRWTMHCIHNHVVDFDPPGNTARGEVYVTAYLCSEEPPILNTFFGRYLDLYEKRDDEWRILRRALVHEGSQAVVSTPTGWPLGSLRQTTFDRPSSGGPIGP
jgi:hypothetical protein